MTAEYECNICMIREVNKDLTCKECNKSVCVSCLNNIRMKTTNKVIEEKYIDPFNVFTGEGVILQDTPDYIFSYDGDYKKLRNNVKKTDEGELEFKHRCPFCRCNNTTKYTDLEKDTLLGLTIKDYTNHRMTSINKAIFENKYNECKKNYDNNLERILIGDKLLNENKDNPNEVIKLMKDQLTEYKNLLKKKNENCERMYKSIENALELTSLYNQSITDNKYLKQELIDQNNKNKTLTSELNIKNKVITGLTHKFNSIGMYIQQQPIKAIPSKVKTAINNIINEGILIEQTITPLGL